MSHRATVVTADGTYTAEPRGDDLVDARPADHATEERERAAEEADRLFRGRRYCGQAVVYFDGEQLMPHRSLGLIAHSPTGFEWGYGGSGPAQLALAMLLEVLPEPRALGIYQAFKWDVVAHLPKTDAPWELAESRILDWARTVGGREEPAS